MKQFLKKGVKGGWTTAGWPKKYGGMGLTFMEQAAINSEMAYWGATWGGDAELILVAPTILDRWDRRAKTEMDSADYYGES